MATFSTQQIKELGGPCVYMFWRGDKCVYIGASWYGLGRCFGSTHPMRKYTDLTLTVEPMPDGPTAFTVEEGLILEHVPEYNVGPPYGKEYRRRYQERYRALKRTQRIQRD